MTSECKWASVGAAEEFELAEIVANKGTRCAPEVVDACARLFADRGFRFD